MIFESHAHYDDKAFDEDREALLRQMPEKGIGGIVNVSASVEGIRDTLALAGKYPFVYAAVGIHPDEAGSLDDEAFAWIRGQCDRDKVVAVGEIGLDYYWDKESHDIQKYWFERQLELAREKGLPVIIHSREAAQDTMDIMREKAQGLPGVIHCFSYSPEMAKEYVRMGYYIGVGGVVTFKDAKKLKETVQQVPLERILLEKLRTGDPIARLEAGSYILMLTGADEENARLVASRIDCAFHRTYRHSTAKLSYRVANLGTGKRAESYTADRQDLQ